MMPSPNVRKSPGLAPLRWPDLAPPWGRLRLAWAAPERRRSPEAGLSSAPPGGGAAEAIGIGSAFDDVGAVCDAVEQRLAQAWIRIPPAPPLPPGHPTMAIHICTPPRPSMSQAWEGSCPQASATHRPRSFRCKSMPHSGQKTDSPPVRAGSSPLPPHIAPSRSTVDRTEKGLLNHRLLWPASSRSMFSPRLLFLLLFRLVCQEPQSRLRETRWIGGLLSTSAFCEAEIPGPFQSV